MAEALPYLVATDETVRAGAWRTDLGRGAVGLPDWLPEWDLAQTLLTRRSVEIDLLKFWEETRLARGTPVTVAVTWQSCYDDLAAEVPVPLDASPAAQLELAVELPGHLVAGTVAIRTSLILAEEGGRAGAIPVAWRRGSVLWRDVKKVKLHGSASQFPISVVDFGRAGLELGAPWSLDVGADLGLPAMGSVLLLLNERFPIVVAAARDRSSDRPELAAIRSALFADVGRVLVEHALAQEDLDHEWPDDSLGAVLQALVSSRFRESFAELRRLRDGDPTAWNARAAAAFGLLREPLP